MNLSGKLRAWLGRRRLEADMAEEMRLHLEARIQENITAGMSAEEARYAALRKFGGVDQTKERCREQRVGMWLDRLRWDLRQSIRSLWRAPAFSLAVMTTFALCLGPNTAILAVLYALVLKPLPFHEAGQLVSVSNVAEKNGGAKSPASVAQYRDFKANADQFDAFALMVGMNFTVGEESTPQRVWGARVSADFFRVFGVDPLLGRFFTAEEQIPGQDNLLVLTQTYWETQYEADPAIIGREIRMGGEPFTVVGVAPRRLEAFESQVLFYKPFEVWPQFTQAQARYAFNPRLLGRLKPGVTLTAGMTQLDALERRFYANEANSGQRALVDAGGYRIGLGRLRDEGLGAAVKAPLYLLQAGALFVLLIGCVNVANLWLARANAKRPEFAIRYALGAGRRALLRQMLVESVMLTGVAAGAGIGIAVIALRVLNRYMPLIHWSLPRVSLEAPAIGGILLAAFAVATVVAVLPFGLLWRSGLRVTESRTASAPGSARVLSGALVIGQVAIALILLVGAGLLIRSFAQVMAVRPGFDAARIVQGRIAFPKGYEDPKLNIAAQQRILTAMKEIPGVEMAALVSDFGVTRSLRTMPFLLRGIQLGAGENQPVIQTQLVSPEFFGTMGIPLLDGRAFTDADVLRGNQPVAIADAEFTERYLQRQGAVGREFVFGAAAPPEGVPWLRIVGVVGRAHLTGLEQRDGLPIVYLPISDNPSAGITLLLRTTRPLADVLIAMRERLRSIDPRLPLYATGTLQQAIDGMLVPRRVIMVLLGIFAAVALVLAAVGLYGVLAYDVSQRTREIGIRAAIGATRGQIVGLVLKQGLWKCIFGVIVGLGGAFYVTRFLQSQLFDVKPTDPAAFVFVSSLLLIVAVLACWLPARRAAKVDPIIALRAE